MSIATLKTTTGAEAEGQTLTISLTDAHSETHRHTGVVALSEGYAHLRCGTGWTAYTLTLGGYHTPIAYI
jgi:hypothetical protein